MLPLTVLPSPIKRHQPNWSPPLTLNEIPTSLSLSLFGHHLILAVVDDGDTSTEIRKPRLGGEPSSSSWRGPLLDLSGVIVVDSTSMNTKCNSVATAILQDLEW